MIYILIYLSGYFAAYGLSFFVWKDAFHKVESHNYYFAIAALLSWVLVASVLFMVATRWIRR
jgi:hypothetical protein